MSSVNVTGFIAHKMFAPVVGGALMLSLGGNIYQHLTLNHVRTERAEARTERDDANTKLGTCQANVTTLEGSVAQQNLAIDNLRLEGEAINARAQAAVARAERDSARAQLRQQKIEAFQPRRGEDRCAAAMRLIDEVTE